MKCTFNVEININIYLLNSRNTSTSSDILLETVRQNTNENNQNLQMSKLLSIV